MAKVTMILVGGFLGAGKTTLLAQAARRLAAKGKRVGLITNDQAPDLVDTALFEKCGLKVGEVSGSCFCCNFPGLLNVAQKIVDEIDADVLIAEPVGSCTDLSATILQPFKDKLSQQFSLSPLSVVADPRRLAEILDADSGKPPQVSLHPSAAYIFRKQLEEADLIVLNKTDLLSPAELEDIRRRVAKAFPAAKVRCLSALTGAGVDEWLDAVLSGGSAGGRIAEVDYDTYAEGEAVLGWLNGLVHLTRGAELVDWQLVCRNLLTALQEEFQRRSAAVGHVKLLLYCETGNWAANLTRTAGLIEMHGEMGGSPERAKLIVNARVEISPEELEDIVLDRLSQVLAKMDVARDIKHMQSLRPGRPRPTHRYTQPVQQAGG